MSTLSQFSGGGIKSIQRGVISFPLNGSNNGYVTSSTATISAVNTAKTMLNFCGSASGQQVYGANSNVSIVASVALTNSTTVTATSVLAALYIQYSSSGTPPTVSYEVIEFY
jgi:hypothetical protein